MDNPNLLDEVFALGLKLSPKERILLIERLASSVEREIEGAPVAEQRPPAEHWGQNLVRLLNELGPIDFVHPEIDDPVEWVRVQREEERKHRLGDWGETE